MPTFKRSNRDDLMQGLSAVDPEYSSLHSLTAWQDAQQRMTWSSAWLALELIAAQVEWTSPGTLLFDCLPLNSPEMVQMWTFAMRWDSMALNKVSPKREQPEELEHADGGNQARPLKLLWHSRSDVLYVPVLAEIVHLL
jgi:hypothetical protein